MTKGLQEFAIDASNITGAGAVELVRSLVPHLLADEEVACRSIAVGPTELLIQEHLITSVSAPELERINGRLWIPRVVFRALYCLGLFRPRAYRKHYPLLVLGDIPLRRRGHQVVLVHTPHLVEDVVNLPKIQQVKNVFMRIIFALNQKCASAYIVQTDIMKKKIEKRFPGTVGRIQVIGQPAPVWLLTLPRGLAGSSKSEQKRGDKLKLFYPAAYYPHKNHKLLAALPTRLNDIVGEIVLTIGKSEFRDEVAFKNILFMGKLGPEAMLREYLRCDALLFLSNAESYGLPIIEAMHLGLPIVAPRLEYVEVLCGQVPYYFEPNNVRSLTDTLTMLHLDIQGRKRPDWGHQLRKIPEGWDEVALKMRSVLIEA